MEEIDHAERELRRGQILWFRGLNRIQTQVWAWREVGEVMGLGASQGFGVGEEVWTLLNFLSSPPNHKTYYFEK